MQRNTYFDYSPPLILPNIKGHIDYYPFGSAMNTRSYSSGAYRYGFNGKEKDNETYGEGNAYDFGARIYDSRLGRWLALDPLMERYPSLSPFCGMGNIPTCLIDADGRVIINPYDKVKDSENYLKVQRAIEIVKLTLPDLYAKCHADPRQITINISDKIAPTYTEPSKLGTPGQTKVNDADNIDTHTLGELKVGIAYSSNLITKVETIGEKKVVSYFQKIALRDAEGNKILDANGKATYKEIPISEAEANKLVTIGPSVELNIAKGVTSTFLLGQTLAHELGHFDFEINHPAAALADKLHGTGTNEEAAQNKEIDYNNAYKQKNDKIAETKAKE